MTAYSPLHQTIDTQKIHASKQHLKVTAKNEAKHEKNALNNSAYDNSDLSDIDKELSVSAVKVPPAPAMFGRTPYQ